MSEAEKDKQVKFSILASPRTKKNHSQIVWAKKGNRRYPKLIPSKQYLEFEEQAGWYCPDLHIDFPVNIAVVAYVERRNRIDLPNMLNAIDDILVKYGVVEDDNRNIIYSHDGSRILYDKQVPRVDITITKTAAERW